MRPLFRGAGIRARIVAAATIALALAVLVGALFIRTQLRAVLYSSADEEVLSHARDIADLVSTGDFDRVLPVEGKEPGWVQIVDEHAQVVSSTVNIVKIVQPLVILKGVADGTVRHLDGLAVDNGNRVTVAVVGANSGGHHYRVIAAGGLAVFDAVDKRILRALSIAFPAMLAVAALTQWLVASRALRPVEAIRKEVAAISTTDLSRRVPEPIADDEIRRLAVTMNSMLGRLQTSLDRQRRFVADASHELRGPLAALRADLEISVTHPERTAWPIVARDTLSDVERLQHLTEDLLVLARLDSDQQRPHQSNDLAALIRDAIREVRRPDIAVTSSGVDAPVTIDGDETQLRRMLRNLIHNAEQHATDCVDVALTRQHDRVTVSISDDGPGIPVADRQQVFERFVRLDDARTRDGGGTGLGLAIVHDIVHRHHGQVRIEDFEPQGTTVVVEFAPLSASIGTEQHQ